MPARTRLRLGSGYAQDGRCPKTSCFFIMSRSRPDIWPIIRMHHGMKHTGTPMSGTTGRLPFRAVPARTSMTHGEEPPVLMAIYVPFEKVLENDHQVEYIFGLTEMNRRLVIDKGSLEATPMDGKADHSYAAAVMKILRFRRSEMRFPASGAYAA
jgi:hypothetical protein